MLQCPELCYALEPTTGLPTQAAQNEIARLGNVAGNEAPRVPKHNVAASANWQAPMPGASALEWFLRNDVLYESKRYSTASNLTASPSQLTWNARIGLESEQWTASIYVNNITDEDSALQIQDFPLFDGSKGYSVAGNAINQNAFQILPRRSRSAGVTAQYRF